MVGHSPVRMSIMASPPAWTNSAGMLYMPADFPIFPINSIQCICPNSNALSIVPGTKGTSSD